MSLRTIVLLMIISTGISSCVKDKESFVPYKDLGLVETLIKRINNGTESYSIDPSVDNEIITGNQTVITIPKNILVDRSNQLYLGDVKVLFTDIVTTGQAILTGTSTRVDGNPFYASVMTMINFVSADGMELKLNEGQTISIYYPSTVEQIDSDQKMFRGLETDAAFNWTEISNPTMQNALRIGNWEITNQSGSIFGSGYQYHISQSGWYGIGKYIDVEAEGSTEVCVDLPDLFNSNNTKVFFVFEDLISIVNLHATSEIAGDFCGQTAVPSSFESMSSIITISSTENEDYYLGMLENPDPLENKFMITPQKKTLQEITDFLYKQ